MAEIDLLADFGDFEPLDSTSAAAERAERIEQARLASSSYSAKLEPAGWFNAPSSTPSHNSDSIRIDLFRLHQLYFKARYDDALELGARMLGSGKGKRRTKGKQEDMIGEETEILDIVLRSALKAAHGVGERELLIPARTQSSSGLAFSSSLVLARAAPALATPLEALEAVLVAIQRRTLLHPYLAHTERLLAASFPALREAGGSARAEMDRIGLSEEGRAVLGVLLERVKAGVDEEEEGEEPRNVRSL